MWRYIFKRLLAMIPTLFIISVISFVLIQLPPGDIIESTIKDLEQQGQTVALTYEEQGARVVSASLIYTTEGDSPRPEWFQIPANLVSGLKVSVNLPPGTTHYFINLVDENNFLVSYPDLPEKSTREKTRAETLAAALAVE